MVDNIALGADGQVNHMFDVLRSTTREGPLSSDVEFLPGFFLNADPALELSGQWRSAEGRILELDAQTGANPGGWVALHISLPAMDLRNKGALGFAARVSSPEIMVVRAALRSGVEGGFEDCFFDKHLLLRPQESSHVDALPIQHRDPIPMQAPWRELLLFLPTDAFRLSLIDLRVFVV